MNKWVCESRSLFCSTWARVRATVGYTVLPLLMKAWPLCGDGLAQMAA